MGILKSSRRHGRTPLSSMHEPSPMGLQPCGSLSSVLQTCRLRGHCCMFTFDNAYRALDLGQRSIGGLIGASLTGPLTDLPLTNPHQLFFKCFFFSFLRIHLTSEHTSHAASTPVIRLCSFVNRQFQSSVGQLALLSAG
jgi:hypothetical protein